MSLDADPIRRRKLSDEVRERLLAQINEGDLRPGDPLPSERELMIRYGVGRPAIREAMQQLASLGLIVVRHGDRPRLAAPRLDLLAEQLALTMRHVLTHDDTILAQLKEARIVVEMGTARGAAEMRTEADLEQLRDILARQLLARAERGPSSTLFLYGRRACISSLFRICSHTITTRPHEGTDITIFISLFV